MVRAGASVGAVVGASAAVDAAVGVAVTVGASVPASLVQDTDAIAATSNMRINKLFHRDRLILEIVAILLPPSLQLIDLAKVLLL